MSWNILMYNAVDGKLIDMHSAYFTYEQAQEKLKILENRNEGDFIFKIEEFLLTSN